MTGSFARRRGVAGFVAGRRSVTGFFARKLMGLPVGSLAFEGAILRGQTTTASLESFGERGFRLSAHCTFLLRDQFRLWTNLSSLSLYTY